MRKRWHLWAFVVYLGLVLHTYAQEVSPDAALDRLVEGHCRFMSDQPFRPKLTQERYDKMKMVQEPFAVIVGCSDSRVPPELIFDQGLGDLFVIRIAGNVVGPIELDSIEYAIFRLHAPLIVVLGHENCGAVQAALAIQEGQKLTDIPHIYPLIKPALKGLGKSTPELLEKATKSNIALNVEVIRKNPRIASLIKGGQVKLVGGYYDLDDCKVTFLSTDQEKTAHTSH